MSEQQRQSRQHSGHNRTRRRRPIYGQVVVGPPGSGKTTYCIGMQDYLRLLGRQHTFVINLDPANEIPASSVKGLRNQYNQNNSNNEDDRSYYDVLLDVSDSVVNVTSVMKQLNLGPNGALMYCMEYMEAHIEEIIELIHERIEQEIEDENQDASIYLLFDLPGQVELYTHNNAVSKILTEFIKAFDLRLCLIQLIDSQYCMSATNFISAALLGTTTMLKLELPTVNVLSKIDLLANYGSDDASLLPFDLQYFTECQELHRLLPYLHPTGNDSTAVDNDNFDKPMTDIYADDPQYQHARKNTRNSRFFQKHEKLHKAMSELIDEFSLLSFLPLDITNAESVGRILSRIDKCNGYVFIQQQQTGNTINRTEDLFQCAIQSEPSTYEYIADIQERISMTNKMNNNDNNKTKQQKTNQ